MTVARVDVDYFFTDAAAESSQVLKLTYAERSSQTGLAQGSVHGKTTHVPRVDSYVYCLPLAHCEGILQRKVNFSEMHDFHNDTEILSL